MQYPPVTHAAVREAPIALAREVVETTLQDARSTGPRRLDRSVGTEGV
jgi:hypothetical protein